MEKDELIPGNILFTDDSSQYTTDGNNVTVVHDFSANGHDEIFGFVQTSQFELIAVDPYHSCLRVFNRLQDIVYKFAGDCEKSGYRDGTDALFRKPRFAIQDNLPPCFLYVTDYGNDAVRMVTNSRTPYVTTLIKNYPKQYTGITQDHLGKYMNITYRDGLEHFDLLRNTSIDISSSHTMFTDSAAMYDNDIGYLSSIILHKRLVVVNVSRATCSTSLVCTGVAGHLTGNSSFCQLTLPFSLFEMDGDIYVGEQGVISILRGK